MEKIKKALEKAREQRGEQTQASAATEGRPAPGVDAEESTINYSRTKVVPIDEAVLKRNKIVAGSGTDGAATAYKILRTQVQQRLDAKEWNALAVTSPGANQGKTLTAINLAVALAREVHRTVLLVDLDLIRPSIHSAFELEIEKGLVHYLTGDVPITEVLVNPGIERLVILPAGTSTQRSSELLSSPKMAKLVEELKSRYPSRIIIFDLPPILSTDDALAFAPYVDTTLLVVEDGATSKDELARAVQVLEGVHLLGTVLNKSDDVAPTYYGS
ncbi:MAG: CpsD/CapB family tyrosine-protein kinase [Pseudomonadota bacterium]